MSRSDDPRSYGSSFADVYDLWYPGGDEHDVVAMLSSHLDDAGRVLELGVGTGRVALALSAAGFEVVGLDGSPEMLARMALKDRSSAVRQVLADAGRPATWQAAGLHGRFDCVLAACNLLLNLPSPRAQRDALSGAARHLVAHGVLAVELQQLRAGPPAEVDYGLSAAAGGNPVVISTVTDPTSGTIEGEHIELRSDGTARIRPWSVCPVELATIDRWCAGSGLSLVSRHADWSGAAWDPASPNAVSIYRRR